jgi:hypothetical protein
MFRFTNVVAAFACCAVLGAAAHAQAVESADTPAPRAKTPDLNIDPATLPPASGRPPKRKNEALKANDSLLSGVDLGGSTLSFEGDRKKPESRVGAETFEPGTLVPSQKSRQIGPTFFGLSIKKSLE